ADFRTGIVAQIDVQGARRSDARRRGVAAGYSSQRVVEHCADVRDGCRSRGERRVVREARRRRAADHAVDLERGVAAVVEARGNARAANLVQVDVDAAARLLQLRENVYWDPQRERAASGIRAVQDDFPGKGLTPQGVSYNGAFRARRGERRHTDRERGKEPRALDNSAHAKSL